MEEKFWMVAGKGPVTARHDSYAKALNEAHRILETDSRAGQLYVLEAVAIVRQARPPVEVISLNAAKCSTCGQPIEASRPRSKKCRACDRK